MTDVDSTWTWTWTTRAQHDRQELASIAARKDSELLQSINAAIKCKTHACTCSAERARACTRTMMPHAAATFAAFALAATALAPPQRAIRPRPRLTAEGSADATADADAPTAEDMASNWKATTDELGAYELIPASYEYRGAFVEVAIPRSAEAPGLGVLLEQFGTLEGGGLTLVAGLVEGGNAANAAVDLRPGDSIVRAGELRTECLDYDATVDALMALPPAPAPATLTVKRLIKVPFATMRIMFPREENTPDAVIKLRRGASLKAEMLRNRISMPTCPEAMECLCTCAVLVRKGRALLEPASTQEKQMIKKEPDWRLTCRACVAKDVADGAEIVVRLRPDLENVLRRKDPLAKYN